MAAQRKLALVPAAIRNGSGIASAVNEALEFDTSRSNGHAAHAMRQQPFLTALLSRLETADGAATVVADV
eukprot:3052335-Prymnesium_polylepis.2